MFEKQGIGVKVAEDDADRNIINATISLREIFELNVLSLAPIEEAEKPLSL